jgi:cysteine desulfurase/selenocysteine lyase
MIPFQIISKIAGAKLMYIPIDNKCDLDRVKYEQILNKYKNRIKFISLCHISNATGTVNPIKQIIEKAHLFNIPVCIDAAQSIAHAKIDVNYLDCDFLAFSGHKCYAPTGIGVLYAKEKYQLQMSPYQYGGGMIKSVTYQDALWTEIPEKFEAGTPNIEGAVALAVALDNFIKRISIVNIFNYEKHLLDYCLAGMRAISGVNIVGEPEQRAGMISFTVDNVLNSDVCTTLNQYGIAARNGFLCAIPLMQKLNLSDGVTRVSFAIYNTQDEIDKFLQVLHYIAK